MLNMAQVLEMKCCAIYDAIKTLIWKKFAMHILNFIFSSLLSAGVGVGGTHIYILFCLLWNQEQRVFRKDNKVKIKNWIGLFFFSFQSISSTYDNILLLWKLFTLCKRKYVENSWWHSRKSTFHITKNPTGIHNFNTDAMYIIWKQVQKLLISFSK